MDMNINITMHSTPVLLLVMMVVNGGGGIMSN